MWMKKIKSRPLIEFMFREILLTDKGDEGGKGIQDCWRFRFEVEVGERAKVGES